MKMGKKIFVFAAIIFFAFPIFAFAAPSWWPIVPCGLNKPTTAPEGGYLAEPYYQPCNPCELFHLGRNIIDFILMGLMPPVAAGLFIWGGFLILMGGPKPEFFTKGKAIFTTTFYGVLVILGSWLITNTVLMSVAQDSVMVGDTVVNIVTDWNKFKCEYTPTDQNPTTGSLTISPDTLPDAVINKDYSQELSVSGGQGSYTWSSSDADSALAPTSVCGFLFDDNPPAIVCAQPDSSAVGSYSFTVQVKDSTTPTVLTATKQYKLTVLAKANPLVFVTTSLPDAVIDQPYSQQISVSGGIVPYDWSGTDASSLPQGLEFYAGKIYGIPSTASSFTFTVKVEDNSSPKQSVSKTFTLKIGSTSACDGATLAQKYSVPYPRQADPELTQLISCVSSQLSNMIDQNQIYTYERTNDLCNYTRGENVCGSCAHKVYSCHYGGMDGNQGALGVDFNAKSPATETQLYNALKELSTTCNFGYIGFKTDHSHVSSKGCSGN